tara:strand:- start:529 stop:966 length:438 start_codon:yes stop_codon:yes gene_type:complete
MKISINISPESPDELARVFAFISGRDGVELAPLDAAAVAEASAAENAAAKAEEAKPAPKKARKKATKKAAPKKEQPEAAPAPVVEDRKQIELDLRSFAAEHGMPELRDALKAAQLPRLQDASDDDLAKFRAVLDQLAGDKGTELI